MLISYYGNLGIPDHTETLLAQRKSFTAPPLTVSLVRNMLRNYAYGPLVAEGLSKAGIPEIWFLKAEPIGAQSLPAAYRARGWLA